MKNKTLRVILSQILVAVFAAICIPSSNATILAYEPFNYATGAFNAPASTATGTPTATTGGGFLTWFSGGAGASIVSGLTYSGLQTSSNALQWSTSVPYEGENLATAITPAVYPTVYVSFLYNAPSYTANKSGFAVDNGGGVNQGYYMGMTSSGTFGVATVDNGSGTVLGTVSSPTISFNNTYFVVVEFIQDSGSAYYQSGNIWINPTPGGSQPAANGTFTGAYTQMTQIKDFLTAMGGSAVICDEIRIGTTWADVTPASGAAPSAPTGLGATPGVNQVTLAWTGSTGATSYNVKRSTTSGTEVNVATGVTGTGYTDTSVVAGLTYYYEVSAVSSYGESTVSSEVSATPTTGIPLAPTGLVANGGNSVVSLSWTANPNATSYKVLRSTTSGAETLLDTTTTAAYSDATAINGTTYYYVVQSVNTAGHSGNSAEVSATPQLYSGVYESFNYPLGSFSSPTPTGTGESSWTGSGTIVSGLTYTDGNNNVLPAANNALQSGGGRQSVTFTTPLQRSGTIYISFLLDLAGNSGGNVNGVYFPGDGANSLYFGQGLFGISTATGPLYIGTTPSGTSTASATKTSDSYTYTFGTTYFVVVEIQYNTSPGNDTVTAYIDPAVDASDPGTPTATLTSSSFSVGTISGIGMNVQGAGTATIDEIRVGNTYASVAGTPASVPSAPTGLIATPGVNQVTLNWNASAGATSYNVLQATSSGGPYTTISSAGAVTATTYTDSTAVNGTAYYYVVQAVNTAGTSGNSSEASATPGTPSQPTILPVYLDGTGANLVVTTATQTGYNYYLLTTPSLTPPVVWSTNNTTAGTGGIITNTVSVNHAQPGLFIKYLVQ